MLMSEGMSPDTVGRILSKGNIHVQYMTAERKAGVAPTLNDSKQDPTDRINQIAEEKLLKEETIPGNDTSTKVVVQRESIPPAIFTEVFSWKNIKVVPFDIIPRKEIPYKRGIPQFDAQWAPYSAKLIKSMQPYRLEQSTQSTYPSTAEYHTGAQNLLNRFLSLNPHLRYQEFQTYHPELMLTALNVTLQEKGGNKIKHSDFRKTLYLKYPKEAKYRALENKIQTSQFCNRNKLYSKSVRDDQYDAVEKKLYNMEVLFLAGIGWNLDTKFSIKDEMKGLIFQHPMVQTKMHAFFKNKDIGCYVIQKARNHYILSIKTDENAIKTHRFTFNKDNKVLKIFDYPSSVTKKVKERKDLLSLIKEWGGKFLLTRDIDQDLLNQSGCGISARDALKGKPKGSFVIEKENDIYVARVKSVALQGADDPAFIMRAIKFKILKDGSARKRHDTFKNYGLVENDYITLIQKFGGTELVR